MLPDGSARLTRASPFSYACAACGRCCHRKWVPLNPYEVARLAHRLEISTGEFLERYAEGAGNALATRPDGSCVFLGTDGCGVHPDRPLACRLYPLGRIARADGDESFVVFAPAADSEGRMGEDATVADWLEAQGAAPYFAAANRYRGLALRMARVLAADRGDPDGPFDRILDVDAVTAVAAARRGAPVPADPEARVHLHLDFLRACLDDLEGPRTSA